jgi:hypothetical protein
VRSLGRGLLHGTLSTVDRGGRPGERRAVRLSIYHHVTAGPYRRAILASGSRTVCWSCAAWLPNEVPASGRRGVARKRRVRPNDLESDMPAGLQVQRRQGAVEVDRGLSARASDHLVAFTPPGQRICDMCRRFDDQDGVVGRGRRHREDRQSVPRSIARTRRRPAAPHRRTFSTSPWRSRPRTAARIVPSSMSRPRCPPGQAVSA